VSASLNYFLDISKSFSSWTSSSLFRETWYFTYSKHSINFSTCCLSLGKTDRN